MMSEQTKGLLITGASIAAGLTIGRVNIGAGKITLKITRKKAEASYKSYVLFRKDALIYSANKPVNEQGLSAVARAWEKHAGRPDGVFIPLKGNVAQKKMKPLVNL